MINVRMTKFRMLNNNNVSNNNYYIFVITVIITLTIIMSEKNCEIIINITIINNVMIIIRSNF